MKWTKSTESLPTNGVNVIALCDSLAGRYYKIGYICCRDGWVFEDTRGHYVLMWSELPPIDPE
jgi:hypothetical protein